MVKNVGKVGFELLGQTGVPSSDMPICGWNGPGLEWPELILPARARRGAHKSFHLHRQLIIILLVSGPFHRQSISVMVKSVGKVGFELLGQTGVPPVIYPNLAGICLFTMRIETLFWTGQERKMCWHCVVCS